MSLTIFVNILSLLGLLIQFISLPKPWQRNLAGIFSSIIFIIFWLIYPTRVPLIARGFLILNFLGISLIIIIARGLIFHKETNDEKIVPQIQWKSITLLVAIFLVLLLNLSRDGYRIWQMESNLRNTGINTISKDIVKTTYPSFGNWGRTADVDMKLNKKMMNKYQIS